MSDEEGGKHPDWLEISPKGAHRGAPTYSGAGARAPTYRMKGPGSNLVYFKIINTTQRRAPCYVRTAARAIPSIRLHRTSTREKMHM